MSVLERVKTFADLGVESAQSPQRMRKYREQLKRELVERIGLHELASLTNTTSSDARKELTVVCSALLNAPSYNELSYEDKELLIEQVLDEVVGLGPIQSLLDDPSITEVMINGTGALFFERGGSLYPADNSFDSDEQIMLIVDRILAPLGRRLDKSSPLVNARLENGDRVHAVAHPTSVDGTAVTIRRFSDHVIALEELVGLGALPSWYAKLLSWAVKGRKSIAVAGGTGSGKTTLLNALSCEIDPAERIITIEDSAELRFTQHPNVVRLEARDASIEGTGEITIRELMKNALRMRPDRIVVGEVRGEEAIDMLQAMNTGHDGSLTTLHAGTAQEAILRLVLMARFGMDLPSSIIEEQIATALDFIVMSQRFGDGQRCITSLSEVKRSQEKGVELVPCVEFDDITRSWSLIETPQFLTHMIHAGLISESEVAAWQQSIS